jgi:hypothetical protein
VSVSTRALKIFGGISFFNGRAILFLLFFWQILPAISGSDAGEPLASFSVRGALAFVRFLSPRQPEFDRIVASCNAAMARFSRADRDLERMHREFEEAAAASRRRGKTNFFPRYFVLLFDAVAIGNDLFFYLFLRREKRQRGHDERAAART